MQPIRGIALKIVSVLVFVTMATLIKSTGGHVPAGEVVFFRSFFAIPVIVVWLFFSRELATGFRTMNPLGHVWRGLVGTTAMGLALPGCNCCPSPR